MKNEDPYQSIGLLDVELTVLSSNEKLLVYIPENKRDEYYAWRKQNHDATFKDFGEFLKSMVSEDMYKIFLEDLTKVIIIKKGDSYFKKYEVFGIAEIFGDMPIDAEKLYNEVGLFKEKLSILPTEKKLLPFIPESKRDEYYKWRSENVEATFKDFAEYLKSSGLNEEFSKFLICTTQVQMIKTEGGYIKRYLVFDVAEFVVDKPSEI